LYTLLTQTNFNGAYDIYTAGLVDVMSEEVGRSLIALVQDEHERNKRIKEIGYWSVAELSKNIVSIVENARGDRGWNAYLLKYHL
jgi:mitochondrial distribution and morphology protein 31